MRQYGRQAMRKHIMENATHPKYDLRATISNPGPKTVIRCDDISTQS